ncbi:unnamed protein product [Closterium sp. Yama58-4]|nr:unnamed protein product [Closterium sp. Yama58-4]
MEALYFIQPTAHRPPASLPHCGPNRDEPGGPHSGHPGLTEHDSALVGLFKEDISTREYELLIDDIATRLSTVFASLKELPTVRYRAAEATGAAAVSNAGMRELVSTELAKAVWDRLSKYKASLPDFPSSDTCDLLILDRSVDPVAPIIHDWSYGGMCFDLLPLDGQKYECRQARTGQSTALNHFAPLSQLQRSSPCNGFSLPEYQKQFDKVELHIKISSDLMKHLNADMLSDLGKVEQGFVFGYSGTSYKELTALINKYPDMSTENKMRLLMRSHAVTRCLSVSLSFSLSAPCHTRPFPLPAFFFQVAKLDQKDMRTVVNLEFLGVGNNKDASSGSPLSFRNRKEKGRVRKEEAYELSSFYTLIQEILGGSVQDEGELSLQDELSRFYPFIQDILEHMHEGKLSLQDYPYMQEPGSTPSGSAPSSSACPRGGASDPAFSLEPSPDSSAAGKTGSAEAAGLGVGRLKAAGSVRPEKPAGSARAAMSARKGREKGREE